MAGAACVLCATLALVGGEQPSEPHEGRSATEIEQSVGFWVGKRVDDLRAAFGEPRKTRRSTDTRVVLTYRLDVLCGEPMFAARSLDANPGVGPEYGPPESDPGSKRVSLDPNRAGKPIAKRFVIDFGVDRAGVVEGYRIKRVKHKKCAGR